MNLRSKRKPVYPLSTSPVLTCFFRVDALETELPSRNYPTESSSTWRDNIAAIEAIPPIIHSHAACVHQGTLGMSAVTMSNTTCQ